MAAPRPTPGRPFPDPRGRPAPGRPAARPSPPARPQAAPPPRVARPRPKGPTGPPLLGLLRLPVLVTLGVTALRLVGELLHGAPWLFGRLPGGGLALVGISWLPPFVGAWLGARLHRAGLRSPSFERVVGLPILAALVFFGIGEGAERLGRAPTAPSLLLAYGAAALAALLVAVAAWPALARPLVVYALAVRLPVALVMLAAMFWRWGTHYDAPPPGFPEMDVLARWLLTGLLPQMTIWVAYTVALALPFSLLGPSIARRIRV